MASSVPARMPATRLVTGPACSGVGVGARLGLRLRLGIRLRLGLRLRLRLRVRVGLSKGPRGWSAGSPACPAR